jgi:hypothetical protein
MVLSQNSTNLQREKEAIQLARIVAQAETLCICYCVFESTCRCVTVSCILLARMLIECHNDVDNCHADVEMIPQWRYNLICNFTRMMHLQYKRILQWYHDNITTIPRYHHNDDNMTQSRQPDRFDIFQAYLTSKWIKSRFFKMNFDGIKQELNE